MSEYYYYCERCKVYDGKVKFKKSPFTVMVNGKRIVKMENKIRFCCKDFQDAYYQYQTIRIRENFPACLDDLDWTEIKPILVLVESFIEKKCSWCFTPIESAIEKLKEA